MYYTNACLIAHGKRWRGQLQYKDDAGKWRKRTRLLDAKGKREAQKELDAWREAMEREAAELRGRGHDTGACAYVAEYVNSKRHEIEPSTFAEYERMVNRLMVPYLGAARLGDLNPDRVRAWVADISETFAPSTCKKALTLLRTAMNNAVDNDLIPKDPTRGVKPPKGGRPRPNALDLGECRRVLATIDAIGQTPALLGAKIALLAGLRLGEVCALRWADVDLEGRALTVSRSIGRGERGYYVKEPKTSGSARKVPLAPVLLDALSERREEMAATFAAAGAAFDEACYVIGGMDGRYMQPVAVTRTWKNLADAMGLKGTRGTRPTFHDLRHTFATQGIAAGVDVKAVSALLGHGNAAMTLNVYADATKDQKRAAVAAIGARLDGAERR